MLYFGAQRGATSYDRWDSVLFELVGDGDVASNNI